MKTKSFLCIVGAIVCLLSIPAAFADNMAGFNMLYQPAVNVSQMNQNGYVGWVGNTFLTSGSTWPYANELGFADPLDQGLQNSHTVDVVHFAGTGGNQGIVASFTVPAGTAAPWYAGYRWVTLPTTLGLYYGGWYRLIGQTDGVDTWGDLLTGNSQISWDMRGPAAGGGPVTLVLGATSNDYLGNYLPASGYEAADYGSSPTSLTQVGTYDTIYPAVNMAYDPNHAYIAYYVPEPGLLSLLGLGGALALALRRKN